MTAPVVIVGVGNPWRGDDGIGWAVIDQLASKSADQPDNNRVADAAGPPVELIRVDGEAARLIDCWDARSLAVVIDAVVTGAPAGAIVELEGELVASHAPLVGSHSLGVGHAAALGAALGRLPDRMVVLGVEAHDFAEGSPLSPAVAAAVPLVVARVEALISDVATCA